MQRTARSAFSIPCRRCWAVQGTNSAWKELARQRTPRWMHTSIARYSDVPPEGPPTIVDPPRIRSTHELYDASGKTRRLLLHNEDTAKRIADLVKQGNRRMTVIDIYTGAGLLAQSLLEKSNVEAVVGAEVSKLYEAELDTLIEQNGGRFQFINLDPFWWDTYSLMTERGHLSKVKKLPWEEEHLGLALTGVIPDNIFGERMVIQQLMCIPEQMWLYDYGRFPTYFLVAQKFAERMMAKAGDSVRHKVAVLLEAVVDIETLIPASELKPVKEHFKAARGTRLRDSGYTLIKISPKKHRLVSTQEELEVLEFLARNLFIHKSTKWTKALKYIAPGADIIPKLIEKNGHTVDPATRPQQLSIEEWGYIVKAFMDWPFRPKDLDQSDVKDAVGAEKD